MYTRVAISLHTSTQHHTQHLLRTRSERGGCRNNRLKRVSGLHHLFVGVVNITFEVQMNGDRLRVRLGFL